MQVSPEVIKAAQDTYKKYGVFASVTIAQYALESAWGKSMSGKNNPFGIKARTGEVGTPRKTWEVINGEKVEMTQSFRDFTSLSEAFDAHGKLLATGSAYVQARASKTPDTYANALTGHYATDPQYGHKLITLMKADNLYQYDLTPPTTIEVTHTTVTVTPTLKPVVPKPITNTAATVIIAGGAASGIAAHEHNPALAIGLGVLALIGVALFIYFHFRAKSS